MADPVLSVRDLRVRIGRREIVRGVSFDVERDATLGIVGESGSGKSMTVLAATGLLDAPGAVVTGTSTLGGASDAVSTQLVGASPERCAKCTGPHRIRLPGPGNVAEPAADRRTADHRIA